MPATSCPQRDIVHDIPTFSLKDPGNSNYLRQKFDDARKHPISSRWSFTEIIQKIPLEQHPNMRPIPSFALDGGQFRFQPVWAPQPATFSGTESFQTSQVWVANVFKVDDGGTRQQRQQERVILKILQPSMSPFPNTDGKRRGSAAHQLAYSEEALYKCLQPLQGSCIPYYFGTFQVALPNGEHAYILILEYIEGDVLETWVTKYETNHVRPQETLPIMVNSIIDAFRAIHAAHVVHTDMFLNLTNVIIRKDGTAVIIDFADCAVFENAEDTARVARVYSRDENQGYRCVRMLLRGCVDNTDGSTRAELREWLQTPGNVPSEVNYPHGPPADRDQRQIDESGDDDDDSSSYGSEMSDADSD